MHEVESARKIIEAALRPPARESLPLARASGRFLAAAVLARKPVPPYACSAMDGWAVRASEAVAGKSLKAGPTLYAGDAPGLRLEEGTAVRVFTGAPIPAGADAVVRQEAAREEPGLVSFPSAPAVGENVRRQGEDVAQGESALEAGVRLGPRQLGLCAALGAREVEVAARLRVALVATGDELVRGLVEDSNRAVLEADLSCLGCEVSAEAVGDDPAQIARVLEAALARADVVLTTAGVSVGEKDLVPGALERLGAKVLVHGVAMKPGKPFLFALAGGKPVFGLPGSPSACLVAHEVFARPFVLGLLGARTRARTVLSLPTAEALEGRPGRARFLWARVTEEGRVKPLGQDVAQLRGPALANALIALRADVGPVSEGTLVPVWLLEEAAP
ncbi:MAG TPA: gephyrin-like molybdotransferase Glp [Myxococcales bacterium]|jgi:molybdopterin molybdotransferase